MTFAIKIIILLFELFVAVIEFIASVADHLL